MEPPPSVTRRYPVARAAGAAVLLAAVAVVYLSPVRDWITIENAREAMRAAAAVWWGPPAFVVSFALLATLLVPATVFVVAASLIWGWAEGGVYSILGATLAAFLSFVIARWVASDFLLRRVGERGRNIAAKLRDAGFGSLLILRLIPIFPFAMLNYACGLAGLRARDVVLATAIGVAPSMMIISYSADAIVRGTLSGEDAFQRILLAGALLAALALVPLLLRRKAGKVVHLEGD
ncbi:MAG TPA: TVP38/TMEM64 family protein [Thermoanaerobaculia bacterium]|nr:TVP38/TMEM64 family protein [Thermoanaerobaculia bacterium]